MDFILSAEHISTTILMYSGRICLAVILFFILKKIFQNISKNALISYEDSLTEHQNTIKNLIRVSRYSVIFLFITLTLIIFGIDLSKLFATLGVTTLLAGMIMKDVISNLLAGLVIIVYRPFFIGDILEVRQHKGRITKIDMRYTVIESEDEESQIFIPNSQLIQDILVKRKSKTF